MPPIDPLSTDVANLILNKPRKGLKELLYNKSTLALLAVNGITIVVALLFEWSLLHLAITFWFQSVIIGYFNYKKLKSLEKGSGPLGSFFSEFFLAHYGGFHAIYALFLFVFTAFQITGKSFGWLDFLSLSLGIGAFFFTHLQSFRQNWPREKDSALSLTLFFFPYLRIIPMHLTILVGFMIPSQIGLLIFLVLKTFADVGMHIFEHRK